MRVWNRATLARERSLDVGETVFALAVWEGFLISGHGGGGVAVWSIATGEREWELEGHGDHVLALTLVGQRLVSASSDRSVKVWAMGAEGPWPCERTQVGHGGAVKALATWEGKVMSGSDDRTIRVWDAGTGALEATLTGHGGGVTALAVHEDRLLSASRAGTIRAWAVGTWGGAADGGCVRGGRGAVSLLPGCARGEARQRI